jgi:hypothetical protein
MSERVTRDAIETWLDDAGLPYEPFEFGEDDSAESYQWGLTVSGQAFGLLVAQRKADYNYVFLQVGLGVADGHQELLLSLDESIRRDFVYDLRLALLASPVGHNMEFEREDCTDVPTRVMFGVNLLEDAIVRSGFLRRNHQIQSAAQLAATMFQKLSNKGTWP